MNTNITPNAGALTLTGWQQTGGPGSLPLVYDFLVSSKIGTTVLEAGGYGDRVIVSLVGGTTSPENLSPTLEIRMIQVIMLAQNAAQFNVGDTIRVTFQEGP